MSSNDDDINDLQKLYAELQAEIDFFVAKDKDHIDPTALSSVERRLFVRSVFSFIEAAVFRIKAGALYVGRERWERLSQLAWCGAGCSDSRRRVNSNVMPQMSIYEPTC